jgi:CheY-like chemotaxis protein
VATPRSNEMGGRAIHIDKQTTHLDRQATHRQATTSVPIGPARSFLLALLRSFDDVVVVGEAASGKEAVTVIEREQPDLALLDYRCPRSMASVSSAC